jgi:hypothetical protein
MMVDYGVTSELFRLLVTQGLNGMDVGAPRGRGETHPLADAAREEETRIRLVFVNTDRRMHRNSLAPAGMRRSLLTVVK